MGIKNSSIPKEEPTNNPKVVKLRADGEDIWIELPRDTAIYIDGDKAIVETRILDGVMVYERVTRNPYNIDFEFNIRELTGFPNSDATIDNKMRVESKFVFPNTVSANYMDKIWEKDSIIKVQNTFLNDAIGIFELIVNNISITTIRGSNKIMCTLKCYENYSANNTQENSLVLG